MGAVVYIGRRVTEARCAFNLYGSLYRRHGYVYRYFIEQTGLHRQIDRLLQTDSADAHVQIVTLIRTTSMPTLADAIVNAYRILASADVAVRSSGVGEDLSA
ncbi:MAG: hypothetical protein HY308_01840 [Gammaproteobacteria bacterium]|nr:hypothetical protein [Gammaproteobacteria bacterium]